MEDVTNSLGRVWRSAKLYIGFHRDQQGNMRQVAKVWSPKNARATIHADPSKQEAFLVVEAADAEAPRDVQIKLRQEKIVLRRDPGTGWDGIIVEENGLSVSVNGMRIRISADGSVSREAEDGTTYLEADGAVLKKTKFVESMMSGDGVELTRRTETDIAAIRHDGVIAKARDTGRITPD